MKVDFTNEVVFSFEGPNLCLLGNPADFKKLSEVVLDLTNPFNETCFEIAQFDFLEVIGEQKKIWLCSKRGAHSLGVFNAQEELFYELDSRNWERLFKYFTLLSWYKRTYYLNNYEDSLKDLGLKQECNFICSSEF